MCDGSGPTLEILLQASGVSFLSRSRSPAAEHMSEPQPRFMDLLPEQNVALQGAFPRVGAEMEVERKRRQEENAVMQTKARLRCSVNFASAEVVCHFADRGWPEEFFSVRDATNGVEA